MTQVQAYTSYTPQDNEQLNYNAETSDVLENAAEYLIELKGYLEELEEMQKIPPGDETPVIVTPNPQEPSGISATDLL